MGEVQLVEHEVVFDPINHTYSKAGVYYPCVSDIFKDMGLYSPFYAEGSAEKGRQKHRLFSDYILGQVDYANVSEEGYELIERLQTFLDREVKEIVLIEKPMVHEGLRFAGTPDLLFYPKPASTYGERMEANGLVLIDWKTGGKERWHKLQAAAYALLAIENGYPVERIGCVYTRNKNWKIEYVEDETYCRARFLSMLDVYEYKHGGAK